MSDRVIYDADRNILFVNLEGWHSTNYGGSLRAAVFGANDGLVSNFSLVMGIAGSNAEPRFVLLAGIAGLLAGASSMAAGEYVSVRSQREMYEYQIGLEKEELDHYPEEEAEEEPVVAAKPDRIQANMKGLSAPANTTLTDGVYDEIRRLRSRVGEK